MSREPFTVLPTVGRALARRQTALRGRGLLTVILVGSLLWSVLSVELRDGMIRSGGLATLADMVSSAVRPDISADTLGRAFQAVWITVVYAVAGMTVALVIGFPLGVLSSGVLASSRAWSHLSMSVGRGILAAMRAVHELVWAWLLVVAIGFSPFAAVFAIGIPYAGILGRIYADLLNDVSPRPMAALSAVGASTAKTLLYGRLPMALPDMMSYTFYRFECAVRASAIMGFVGLGGLGFQIQIALADLRYSSVSTYLIALIVLIVVIEAWSSKVRGAVLQ